MRKVLEDLVFIGKLEKEYPVYGKKWVLTTLTSDEQLEATSATANYDTLARVSALKIEILARSLKSVGGVELVDLNESSEFVGKLQTPIINALFTKYEELQQEQDEALKDLEDLKN